MLEDTIIVLKKLNGGMTIALLMNFNKDLMPWTSVADIDEIN